MWLKINSLLSPKKFFYISEQCKPWLALAFVVSFGYGLLGGLIWAPADYLQGDGFRIMYVHAPCAFLSLFIYAVISIAALVGIVWRIKLSFLVIKHSLPLGAVFTFLALLTGSIWGKPMWGTWWLWDARLTSELILLFIYMGLLLFQSAVKYKTHGERIVAILVLVGCVDLPIIHYSVYWWNTLHQGASLNLGKSSIDPSMLYPLLAMSAAFIFYYALVLIMRINYELISLQANHHWLRETS